MKKRHIWIGVAAIAVASVGTYFLVVNKNKKNSDAVASSNNQSATASKDDSSSSLSDLFKKIFGMGAAAPKPPTQTAGIPSNNSGVIID